MTLHIRLSIALSVAVALSACAGKGPPGGSSPPGGPSVPAVNAAEAPLLPVLADELPAFTVARLEELLGQLRGTPVVVNLWGSWCPPCRAEAPLLAAAHARFGGRVQFLGIDIEDGVASARAFMREYGWTFPSVRDPSIPSSIRPDLGFAGQPDTLFYDASGELVSTWQGPLTADRLASGIRTILRG